MENHIVGFQNYGPFLDPYHNTAPDTPKQDHNFDNHLYVKAPYHPQEKVVLVWDSPQAVFAL